MSSDRKRPPVLDYHKPTEPEPAPRIRFRIGLLYAMGFSVTVLPFYLLVSRHAGDVILSVTLSLVASAVLMVSCHLREVAAAPDLGQRGTGIVLASGAIHGVLTFLSWTAASDAPLLWLAVLLYFGIPAILPWMVLKPIGS
jgi:hypothetical protein